MKRDAVVSLGLLGALALAPVLLFAQDPVPFVNQPLVPSAVAPGGPDFTLSVNGTGFVSGATINWNGTSLATNFVSSSQLTATVPAANRAALGTATITVTNPGPGGGTSNFVLLPVSIAISSLSFRESDFGTTGNAYAAAAADFNGDGKPDVAMVLDSEVDVFLGRGDGTFETGPSLVSGGRGGASKIIACDLNQDGKADLVVPRGINNANTDEGLISVFLGNGDGTFQSAVDYSIPQYGPYSIACADFNRDGKLDIATLVGTSSTSTGFVAVLLGNGDGTLQAATFSTSAYGFPNDFAVGDFDRDGLLDLAVTSYYPNYLLTILLGNGDGTFRQGVNTYPYGPGGVPAFAADFNGDGKLDFLTVRPPSTPDYAYALFFSGAGNGTFGGQSYEYLGQGSTSNPSLVADLNGDGKLDLAYSTQGAVQGPPYNSLEGFGIALGNGAGVFNPSLVSYSYGARAPLAVADFDSDGRLDLVGGNSRFAWHSVFMQPSPVDLNPRRLAFGDQLLGTPDNVATSTLTNNLAGPLTINSISLDGPSAGDFIETNDCPLSPSTLPAGGTCTITISFMHVALGEKAAAVNVADSSSSDPQQVLNLTGTVVNPTATLSATSLDFGNQPVNVVSSPLDISITNSGSGDLTISGLTASGNFAATKNCGSTVPEGGQCTVSITFDPSGPGTLFGVLTINDNAPDSPQTVSLKGTGIAPTVSVSPASLTFEAQLVNTISPPQTVNITNNGPGPLTVGGASQPSNFGVSSNCPDSLAVSANCTFSVIFTPTVDGPVTRTLSIYDNGVGNPHAVSLSGAGLGPVSSLSPTTLDFPDQLLGTASAPQTVTLTNTGGAKMTLAGISASGPFSETDNCTATLAADASCSIQITFSPTVAGDASGSLKVTSDSPSDPSADLAGAGTPFLVSSSSPLKTVSAGGTATYTLNVTTTSGYVQPISFDCSGVPMRATCTVSPNPVVPSGDSPATATVSVTTTAGSFALRAPYGLPPAGGLPATFVALASALVAALVLLRLRGVRTRKLRWALPAAVLLAALSTSCGGGGNTVVQRPGTPSGNYVLTVTARSTSGSTTVAQTLTLNLVVN